MIWVGVILLVLIIILFMTSIKVELSYKRKDQDDHILITASVWANLIRFRYEIPALQIRSLFNGADAREQVKTGVSDEPIRKKRFRVTKEDARKNFRRVYKARKHIRNFDEIAKQIGKQIACERLEWSTRIGAGDAAVTGMATGGLWGIKTNVVGLMAKYMRLQQKPKLAIIPDFQNRDLKMELLCILRFRIGNIIIAGTRTLFKLRKGRERSWRNTLSRV